MKRKVKYINIFQSEFEIDVPDDYSDDEIKDYVLNEAYSPEIAMMELEAHDQEFINMYEIVPEWDFSNNIILN